MRRPPPPHLRSAPKTRGSGRRRGSLNRRTVELRALMTALTGDVDYQQRFRRAFVARRLHPTTEIKVWEYVVGKPAEQIELSANLAVDARLAEERELFAQLDLADLEQRAGPRCWWARRQYLPRPSNPSRLASRLRSRRLRRS